MRAETDFSASILAALHTAVVRRRAPGWVLACLPPLCVLRFTLVWQGWITGAAGALLLAALAWIGCDKAQLRKRVRREWTSWLDAAYPQLEDSSALLATAPAGAVARLQRSRIVARAEEQLDAAACRRLVSRHIRLNLVPFALAAFAALTLAVLGAAPKASRPQQASPAGVKTVTPVAELVLHIAPPSYTGGKPYSTQPRDLQVPQHSSLRWCAQGAEARVEMSDGSSLAIRAGECAGWVADQSVFWRSGGQASQRFNIRVLPDQEPVVTVVAPAEAVTVLPKEAQSVRLAVNTRDDYGIERATLHLTLARGSGENIRFSDREVPLPRGADPRVRNWQKVWTLAELGMEPGDELYFFVRASDNAPEHPHTVQTPTYTLRLPGPQQESLDATALPSMVKPENLRSQRQIIIDTEQLLADMQAKKLSAAVVRERSEGIAADQAQLRRRYGQFLGEESTLFADTDHDEHDHKPMSANTNLAAQFGHAHDMEDNATIFDPQTKTVLRRAITAMWDAEKALAAITPKSALAPEYKALDAIKELQQAERIYLHRTAFAPPAIKEEKRLSGDAVGAQSYKRRQAAAQDPIPAEVRELVQQLSGDAPLPALWRKTANEAFAKLADDESRLAAQAAAQDVADGCAACRAPLRAWLRSTLTEPPVLLQGRTAVRTRFGTALQEAPR
ncbi:DUF4175 domain-containing protein [Massilia endophytica]|uniref:DUF4175 domain-containing protein n=1 Tax=Massilia endophytica TaxID=2899220 RepID=UPI001E5636E0|nr:DUF4175 domain-containing protein [Massilia endophytica]UGQ46688.1 DUF4175 domain-containing protein [Massilia endophytica]